MHDFSISEVIAVLVAGASLAIVLYLISLRGNIIRNDSSYVCAKRSLPLLGNALEFSPEKFLSTIINYPKRYGDVVEFYLGKAHVIDFQY
jgi:hypothetical protein